MRRAVPLVQLALPLEQHTSLLESQIPNPQSLFFVRNPRAKRYVIRVAHDGTVRITIPRWGSKREATAFAERERAWIEKQRMREEEERAKPRADPLPVDVARALRERAARDLPPRLFALAAQHGLTVSRVSVRNQKWRWGSCSRDGHICLNWRLIRMPDSVRDYVMIHELMHLKRLDHSPKFWKLVAAAYPAFQDARAWLRSQPIAGFQPIPCGTPDGGRAQTQGGPTCPGS